MDSERPWRGGQNQVLMLMRRQRARGDDPRFAGPPDAALFARAEAESIPVHPVPMRGSWDLPSVFALARLHREIRPEIVHWHAARAHAIGAMAAFVSPGPARVLSRRTIFPVRRSIGSRFLYSLPIDRIAAISGAVRDALVRSGVNAGIIEVVPSGIDPAPSITPAARRETRSSLACAEDDVVAITVAALTPEKGHETLLAAMREAPRLRLWIAGEGPLREALETRSRSYGLERRVQFLGFRADVTSLLQAADFFCLATRSEGLGSSLLEAMAAGLPIVATRVGGVPEIVQESVTGILLPPEANAAEWADALARMTGERGLREGMASGSRARAALFTADRTAEGTYGVYREALASRRARSA